MALWYAQLFVGRISGARLQMIADAGLLIGLEQPAPYAQAVVGWGRAEA